MAVRAIRVSLRTGLSTNARRGGSEEQVRCPGVHRWRGAFRRRKRKRRGRRPTERGQRARGISGLVWKNHGGEEQSATQAIRGVRRGSTHHLEPEPRARGRRGYSATTS